MDFLVLEFYQNEKLLSIFINKYAIFFRPDPQHESIIYQLGRVSLPRDADFHRISNSMLMLIATGCQEVLLMKQ